MIRDLIVSHFQEYRKLHPWSFCWKITIECLIVSCVGILLFHSIFNVPGRHDLKSHSALLLLIYGIILGPWLETLLCQSLPIHFARFFKANFNWQILISTLIFAIGHFSSGVGSAIGAGIIGGFYFSFTYAHWSEKSV